MRFKGNSWLQSLYIGALVLAASSTSSAAPDNATPPVHVQLKTPWTAPPLLYEILEAVHTEDREAFFPLLTHLLQPNNALSLEEKTDQDVYDAARRVMDEHGLLNEAGSRSNWDISLALHAESMRVSAFWQMYETAGLHERLQKEEQRDFSCSGSWVDLGDRIICSASAINESIKSQEHRPLPELTALDHVYGGQADLTHKGPIAVLYADPYSPNTWQLHKALMDIAGRDFTYVLRWKPTSRHGHGTLSGYGAYLDLKKVDYLVIDDRKLVDTAAAHHAQGAKDEEIKSKDQQAIDDRNWMNKQLKASAQDEAQNMASLSTEELTDISVKATQVIMKSRNPLRALRQLSQDFPAHAVSLARNGPKPSKNLLHDVQVLEDKVDRGAYLVAMNGRLVSSPDSEMHPFSLIDALRTERGIINALGDVDIAPQDAIKLLTSKNVSSAYARNDANLPYFDASDRIEQGEDDIGAIAYLNDLEAEGDPRYIRFPKDLKSLLRPMYPGSFPYIRRNVFNIILALDLEKADSIRFLSDTVQLATSKIGLRWGVVPINLDDESSPSTILAKYYWLVNDKLGGPTTGKYLRRVAFACKDLDKIDVEVATQELDKMLEVTPDERIELLADMNEKRVEKAKQWARRLRATPGNDGHVFLNGLYIPFHNSLLQSLGQLVMVQLQSLAEPIYRGKLDADPSSASHYFYDLPTTFKSRSALLFPEEGSKIKTKAVSLGRAFKHAKQLFAHQDGDEHKVLGTWLVGDFDTAQGARFAKEAVEAIQTVPTRLGFLHTGTAKAGPDDLSARLNSLLSSQGPVEIRDILGCINGKTDGSTPEQCVERHDHLKESIKSAKSALLEVLGLPSGIFGILINGRLTSHFDPDQITSSDFSALLAEEERKASVVDALLDANHADQTLVASSIAYDAFFVPADQEGFFHTPSTARGNEFDLVANKETTFTFGDHQNAKLHFDVLFDPLSVQAQKWSSILQMLSHLEDVYVRVILNPSTNVTSIPLKRFYRYSIPDKLTFDQKGKTMSNSLSFLDMPQDAVLTMGLDAPPTWLTMPEEAIYDLDNIRLRDAVTSAVSATYLLKNILIEGHARDTATRATPRGLQLILETLDGSTQLDTIVMANLAYFQFQAKPGLYRLRLRDGRSADLYDMHSAGNLGWDSPPINETGDYITLGNIQGLTIYPRVTKKSDRLLDRLVDDGEGQKGESPLDATAAEGAAGGILGKAQQVLGSWKAASSSSNSDTATQSTNTHGEINVFTVASGHLYERMTYIMILSVLKHTKHSVKFWFIENFLSPSFKSFIPLLAQQYNFTYELVTYAWPHWLRHQSEKQRSIWGMKVLFLDVLFPLDLNKVIFVDADQIVRADLMELINTDLQGAPYGLPPMGNDSYDMDNFRFWESGYWEKFLQGKPYPISALFVVDLNRFRLVAAGDKLRGHYQALSADPNSLSNLDQDLVASMIHTVPIHSLDKEWLWCETWCSWDWYDKAKSIDLCSNPKTHEPKLDRARRQIPEWTTYDEEVAAVAREFEEQGKLGANVVAAKSDVGQGSKAREQDAMDSRPSHDEL